MAFLAGSLDGTQPYSVIRLEGEFVGPGERPKTHHRGHPGNREESGTAENLETSAQHAEKISSGGGDLVLLQGGLSGARFGVGGEGENYGYQGALAAGVNGERPA